MGTGVEDVRFEKLKSWHVGQFERSVRESQVDPEIVPLCRFINLQDNFFTSSSCSGRTVLLDTDGKKNRSRWTGKWHREVTGDELFSALKKPSENTVFFKTEPFIIHIVCKTIEDCKMILKAKENAGVRRGGIFSMSEGKNVVEIMGSNKLEFPIKDKGVFLADEKYLLFVLNEANSRIRLNRAQLKRFGSEIEKAMNKRKN
ncbi:MAG: hypothetical protein J7K00_02100 [Candidatus Diapherotrites archaeon]|nr:hypothetical protein [Candidatus Diapherotrites archaeon]